MNDVEFESEVDVNNNLNTNANNLGEANQPSMGGGGFEDGGVFNGGGASLQDGVYEEGNHNDMDHFAEGVENAEDNEGGEGEEDEGESVYMIDGVVMRMIQIEGEDN